MLDSLLNELRGSIGTPLQKGEWDAIRHFCEDCSLATQQAEVLDAKHQWDKAAAAALALNAANERLKDRLERCQEGWEAMKRQRDEARAALAGEERPS